MPGNPAGGNPAGGDGDEAAWLDLIARFDAPASEGGTVPWPEREDLAGPVRLTPITPEALPGYPRQRHQVPPPGRQGAPDSAGADKPGKRGEPEKPGEPGELEEEHYIPPPPPPLPKLDSVTKVAWLALFGGPIYLLIATAIGSPISGLAAFGAVAAFVGGFVVLVLRMDGGGPRDSGPGNGAVV
jgi:hypothetical protein